MMIDNAITEFDRALRTEALAGLAGGAVER